ncbi:MULTISPECIES: hypothetical protein [Bacillales]|jgi:hypothetical protein|nr:MULTISPECIES: hypothetical protein [Bacillales]
MTYIVILSALFFGGIIYILMAGAGIVRDDDAIQDQILKQMNESH